MHIRELHLKNFCQHEATHLELGPGLVGIYGRNGAGKSNAINVGAYGALTNDFSRHPGRAAGCVRQGIGEKDKASVSLVLDYDGAPVKITRQLAPTVKSKLEFGETKLTKATEIAQWFETTCGLTQRVVGDYVFIEQNKLFEFIVSKGEARAKMLARLCQTELAENAWKFLGQVIQRDSENLVSQVDTATEVELQKAISTNEGAQKQTKKELASLEKQLKKDWSDDTLSEYKHDLSVYQKARAAIRDLTPKVEKTAGQLERLNVVREELQKLQATLKPLQDYVLEKAETRTRATTRINEWKAYQSYLQKLQQARENHQAAQTALDEFLEQNAQPEFDAEILKEAAATVEELTIPVHELGQRKSFLEGEEPCVVCQSEPTKASPKELAKVCKEFDEKSRQLGSARNVVKQQTQLKQQLEQWASKQANLELRVEAAANHLQQLVEDEVAEVQEDNYNKASAFAAKYDSKVAQQDEARAQVESARSRLTVLEQAAAQAEKDKAALDAAKSELEALEPTVEDKKQYVEAHAEATNQILELKTSLKEKVQHGEDLKSQLLAFRKRQEQCQQHQRWLQVAKATRDIIHREELPRRVHARVLRAMEERINAELEEFHSPFRVSSQDDLSFMAHFETGLNIDARALSGGQKVMLAFAFWVTVHDLFADQLGLLVFDEPTDGLDLRNRERAVQVFSALGRRVKERGHQILVVTHDELLQPAFHQVMEIGAIV